MLDLSEIGKLPVVAAPEHTRRFVLWNEFDQEKSGRIYLLVGYCPETLPYYLGLTVDVLKAFPDLDLNTVSFGRVTKSVTYQGFTLLTTPINGPKRKIEGYLERTQGNLDISY